LHIFLCCNCKTSRICHQQTKLSSPSEQGSNWHTSWDKQACTPNTLWQRYVTTSKECLINCHILFKYFELIFLWLQLVEILCKLIVIWVNNERKKKGSIFMKHRVYLIWKPVCDFLLVMNSNLSHILHRLATIHPWQMDG